MHTRLAIRFVCLILAVASVIGAAAAMEEDGFASEIHCSPPGKAWKRTDARGRHGWVLVYGQGCAAALAVWPVDPRVGARWVTPDDHTKGYFAMERTQARPPGFRWHGFAEGVMNIHGRRIPVLTFSISHDEDSSETEGAIALWFPDDFVARQRFYAVMWSDTHPAGKQGRGRAEFETAMASFRVGPAATPSYLLMSESLPADLRQLSARAARDGARLAAERLEEAASFRSECAVIDRSRPEFAATGGVLAQWTADHEKPDRFHVVQRAWDGGRYVFDEWKDIRGRHYDSVGLWFQTNNPEADLPRRRISASLGSEGVVKLLRHGKPQSAASLQFAGREYHVLTFSIEADDPLLRQPADFTSLAGGPYVVRVWLDAASNLPARISISGARPKTNDGHGLVESVRTFGQWGTAFEITPPVLAVK